MKAIETKRLIIDEITPKDAAFALRILNDTDFIHYVADRGIRTETEARAYIADKMMASYKQFGYGMGAVRLKSTGEVVGMCGLVNRDSLEYVDIGYAFLPSGRGQGYALEAAEAVMEMGKSVFELKQLAAIIHPDNKASRTLAIKLGMTLDSMIQLTPKEEEICLYLWTA